MPKKKQLEKTLFETQVLLFETQRRLTEAQGIISDLHKYAVKPVLRAQAVKVPNTPNRATVLDRLAKYGEIRGQLNTGDLVLFSGGGSFSALIKLATGSKWSHVGMIVRLPGDDSVFIWESADKGVNLATLDEQFKDVKLSAMSNALNRGVGDVAIRRLEIERTEEMIQTLETFRKTTQGRPYETNQLELLRGALGETGGNTEVNLASF